ncbi:putative F-box protein [Senna tora]|uniref:Putative F-box protein n=1 Tax=Senna tora TaxID=362788 RepID=A0A834X3T3_9FABA|nr:putative F-box protein [Senna tora]
MGGSRILMKRVARHNNNNNNNNNRTSIQCLPKDLLVDIFAKVASHSSTDLFNLKFCSRHFLDASQDNYIYQQVSLNKFPFIHWFPITHQESSFLNRCKECGNLESLFRQGMLQFFSHIQFDQAQGFLTLQKAAREGHKEAMYVVALILLCGHKEDGLERQRNLSQALQYLRFLRMRRNSDPRNAELESEGEESENGDVEKKSEGGGPEERPGGAGGAQVDSNGVEEGGGEEVGDGVAAVEGGDAGDVGVLVEGEEEGVEVEPEEGDGEGGKE